MAISFDKALGLHEGALHLRAKRAEVLADNLANAETPGYKARDFNFNEVLQSQQQLQMQGLDMQTTRQGHIDGGATITNDNTLLYRTPLMPSIDGNTVDENTEQAAFAKNTLDFQATFTFLNGRFKGLTNAIKGDQ